jgi:hypothetical protein
MLEEVYRVYKGLCDYLWDPQHTELYHFGQQVLWVKATAKKCHPTEYFCDQYSILSKNWLADHPTVETAWITTECQHGQTSRQLSRQQSQETQRTPLPLEVQPPLNPTQNQEDLEAQALLEEHTPSSPTSRTEGGTSTSYRDCHSFLEAP